MSVPSTARADSDRDLPDTWAGQTAGKVLGHLVGIADESGRATASMREIATALGIGAATVRRAIALLIKTGHVVVVRRGTGGTYRTRYRLVGVGVPREHDDDLLSLAG